MTTSIKIDQFTLVLQSTAKHQIHHITDWHEKSEKIIETFLELSELENLFSISPQNKGLPNGYSFGYTFEDTPHYFCIAYNHHHPNMGVIVKFSAQFWTLFQEEYEQKFGKDMQLNILLNKTNCELYTSRLSRLDIAIDFINEGIDMKKISHSLESNRLELRYGKYRQRTH